MLLLSIFPGIDMLGRAFEAEGFCVVRGPDLIWGGDIRDFHPPAGRFDGIIGGSPCQDYSKARRSAPTGYGDEMLREFARVVTEAQVPWFVLENVDRVPDIFIFGYGIQRHDPTPLATHSVWFTQWLSAHPRTLAPTIYTTITNDYTT